MPFARGLTIAAAAVAALAILGFVIAARQPTYLPPPGDQIDILLELAGVFPDKYAIMWREHGILRSTDPESMQDPSLLRDAQFMHTLTTGARNEVDLYVEVAYRFYASDHELDLDSGSGPPLGKLSADQGVMMCTCVSIESSGTDCTGSLAFGNYEFSLEVAYNREQCRNGVNPQVEEEFRHSMQTADRLVALYLRPLRRKASWL